MNTLKLLLNFKGLIFILSLSILSLTSCDDAEVVEPKGSLEVTVRGTFSGKPRENIRVQLYLTKSDADDHQNPIKSEQTTDSDGKTTFSELRINISYWVRADAILSGNIEETQSLKAGSNSFEIRLL